MLRDLKEALSPHFLTLDPENREYFQINIPPFFPGNRFCSGRGMNSLIRKIKKS